MTINAVKILLASISTFVIAFSLSPLVIHFFKKHEMWKKNTAIKSLGGGDAHITLSIRGNGEKHTVRPGGVVIWLSVFVVASAFWLLSENIPFINKIDFVSRNQTWLIIFGMVFSGILGLIDDISVCGKKLPFIGDHGLSFQWRIFFVFLFSIFVAWWFFTKLGFFEMFVPFFGLINFGLLAIPMILVAMIIMSTVSVIDGIDGLSGGLFATSFAAYGLIAIAQDQINIAAFCFAVVGACTAFLWFNIMPAKYYNSETGVLSLSTSLTLIAFLTNQLFILPIIALPLLSGPASAIIQLLSKKIFKKKVLLVAPLHHHFQASGMASHTVVMRYWIFSIICAFLGIVIALAGSI